VPLHQLLVRRARRVAHQQEVAQQPLLFPVHPSPAQGELNQSVRTAGVK
jgi:hypothetical protein